MAEAARSRVPGLALRLAFALSVGTAGGALFYTLQAPLPWMLGPMLACGLGALLRLPIAAPAAVRPPMAALIGTVLGTSFGAGTFARAGEWLVPLAGAAGLVVTAGTLSYLYFRRIGGLDHATAFFSGMPGGIVDMALLGAERGGDDRMIALIHAARIFIVVMLLPFLVELSLGTSLPRASANAVPLSALTLQGSLWFAGTLAAGVVAGRLLRLPASFLFGPLIASALVHATGLSNFTLPSVVLFAAQTVIGTMIGCRFVGTPPRKILAVIALSFGSTALLLAATLAFSFAVSRLTGHAVTDLILAYSPGGLPEMSLIALALDGEVAFVLMHHTVRIALVLALSATVFGFVIRAAARRRRG